MDNSSGVGVLDKAALVLSALEAGPATLAGLVASTGLARPTAHRLAVALDALLENAVAHTDKDDRIELSARVEDGDVILAVADSGCGIPPADLERVFGRFSRAAPYRSRESGGFGLGLPTVAAIAEAHHGSVRVHSTVGEGSTFELLIPAGLAAAVNGNTSASAAPSAGVLD